MDGDEVVIGFEEVDVFLALPPDAVALLDELVAGRTVGEARLAYQARYHELPDVQAFLDVLERKGVVQPLSASTPGSIARAERSLPPGRRTPSTTRYHFASFPQALAQRLFGRPALIASCALIALALGVVVAQPSVIPGWRAFVFQKDFTLMTLGLIALQSGMTFLHELAHLVAARARGIPSRLGIGNRLWVLVAETDMTGIWALPRRQRYLPLVAGPLVDALFASILVLVLFADGRGWLPLPSAVRMLGRAALLTSLLGLLWQCYFFVRTDFYYVVSNLFRCKNLLGDTTTFLRNQVSRLTGLGHVEDQSRIPAAEMRVVRWFSIVWLAGRLAAAWVFCFVLVPALWGYGHVLLRALRAGYTGHPYAFIDALLLGGGALVAPAIGLWMWIRSSVLKGGRTHGLAV